MLRGVEFFIVLGTRGDPSQGTLPFPSHFFPRFALSFKAFFFYLLMKSHSSLLSKGVWSFYIPVCACECVSLIEFLSEVVNPVLASLKSVKEGN